MILVYLYLKRHMLEVFFAYGLVFFVMGLAILLQYRARSAFKLANSLRFLAAFGIIHGLGEWGSIFIPMQATGGSPLAGLAVQRVLWAISFTLLLAFALELLVRETHRERLAVWLPTAVFTLWFVSFIIYGIAFHESHSWIDAGETWERYLLALPALALTTYALIDQYRVLRPFNPLHLTVNVLFLAGLFGIYTVLSGLVVPYAPFFPANWLNTVSFLQLTYVPVQVARTLVGLGMAFFTIRLLRIFSRETDRQLAEAARQRSIALERERIGMDLHDGVIQRIYGAGLLLENAIGGENDQACNPALGIPLVQRAIVQLNQAIEDLRGYLRDLEPPQLAEPDLRQGLTTLIHDFQAASLLPIELNANGRQPILTPEQTGDLYHVVLEALQNVRRHSGATAVRVDLLARPGELEIRIFDNGAGFDTDDAGDGPPRHGRGLHNMTWRAEAMGGSLRVDSEPGRGTTVRLILPVREGTA